MHDSAATLVCFAVKEEAAFFKPAASGRPVKILLTGMGRRNAERAVRDALKKAQPAFVFSCGFAGGLNPDLRSGEVVFATEATQLKPALLEAGTREVQFYCAERVVVTTTEKQRVRETTKADAVEMESQVIADLCREQGIPAATVRVILDVAGEDLALDFNALMTPDQRMDYIKLALMLIRRPGKLRSLIRMQKQCRVAAQRLAQVLMRLTGSDSSAAQS
jgi:nucleoside phosphorylase